jgi:hypothetical protein
MSEESPQKSPQFPTFEELERAARKVAKLRPTDLAPYEFISDVISEVSIRCLKNDEWKNAENREAFLTSTAQYAARDIVKNWVPGYRYAKRPEFSHEVILASMPDLERRAIATDEELDAKQQYEKNQEELWSKIIEFFRLYHRDQRKRSIAIWKHRINPSPDKAEIRTWLKTLWQAELKVLTSIVFKLDMPTTRRGWYGWFADFDRALAKEVFHTDQEKLFGKRTLAAYKELVREAPPGTTMVYYDPMAIDEVMKLISQLTNADKAEVATQIFDQLPLSDRAEIINKVRKAAMEAADRQQKEFEATIRRQQEELQTSMAAFGFQTQTAKPKASPKEGKTGPCSVCKFEKIPPHDGRQHRFQGKSTKVMTDDQLKERGYKKITA